MARGKHRPEVIPWADMHSGTGLPSFPGQRLLAEGDSWFSMSGFPAYNLLFALRFRKITQIVSCAFPGDTIVHISELAKNRNFREALTTPGCNWRAILLSGGGNDLIDEADDILIPEQRRDASSIGGPADYCDQERLQKLIDEVQGGYRRLAGLRAGYGSHYQKAPMITHTYDYATPRNAPARFFFLSLGPWLYPALKGAQVPQSAWVPVADYLIDRLAEGILSLQKGQNRIKNFYVLDTRGTLKRAKLEETGSSPDWQNEIHPNDDGYKKLAKILETKLAELIA